MDEELKGVREAIDRLDQDLLQLLNRRMELACEVGRIKAAKGLALFDPGREEIVYNRLTKANRGPLTEESLRAIYREIIAASRRLQCIPKVALKPMGIEGFLCGCMMTADLREVPSYLSFPGLGLLEWRLDSYIKKYSFDYALEALKVLSQPKRHPVLATNRPVREGGEFEGTEDSRLGILHEAVAAGAEWVDLEDGTPAEDLSAFRSQGARVVISHHEFTGTPDGPSLRRMVEGMAARGADVLKIATYAHSPEDNLRTLELIPFSRKNFGIDAIAFCMGPLGKWSRMVSLLLGAPWTYVQLPGQPPAAPGQFTMEEMQAVLEAGDWLPGA